MTYPSAAAMGCLKALCCAVEVTFDDAGDLVVGVPADTVCGYAWVRFPLEAQDELTARGWVALVGTDEIEVTEAGRYYLARYLKDHKRGRVK